MLNAPVIHYTNQLGLLTEDERKRNSWVRILHDASFYQSWKPNGIIDHKVIQRLAVNVWLNDEIVHAYLALCKQKNADKGIKIISTWFWDKLASDSSQDGMARATRIFLGAIVS